MPMPRRLAAIVTGLLFLGGTLGAARQPCDLGDEPPGPTVVDAAPWPASPAPGHHHQPDALGQGHEAASHHPDRAPFSHGDHDGTACAPLAACAPHVAELAAGAVVGPVLAHPDPIAALALRPSSRAVAPDRPPPRA